jgi:hypothetical protein
MAGGADVYACPGLIARNPTGGVVKEGIVSHNCLPVRRVVAQEYLAGENAAAAFKQRRAGSDSEVGSVLEVGPARFFARRPPGYNPGSVRPVGGRLPLSGSLR